MLKFPVLPLTLALLGMGSALPAAAKIKETIVYVREGKSVELRCSHEESGKTMDCPEATMKRELGRKPVEIAFNQNDFAELDAIFERVMSGEARFADGASYLTQYEMALAGNFDHWKTWDNLASIKKWQTTRPGSSAAIFAEAIYWQRAAWHARGGGYAQTVTPEGWAMFKERLDKSHACMEKLRPIAKRFPAWYAFKISLAIDQDQREEMRAVFEEGAAVHPAFYPIYMEMSRSYEPKWGGDAASFEQFARETVKLAKGFEGRGLYARMFWSADTAHSLPLMGPDSQVPSWTALNAGFADLMQRYPDNHNILNRYASYACRANDGALYRKLRTRLGDYLDEAHFEIVPVDVCDRRFKWHAPAKPATVKG